MSSALYMYKEIFMKQLLAIILAAFTLTAYASEPVVTDSGVKLAKKKDHSKDKKATPAKSPKSDKKAPNKTDKTK